MRTAKGRVCPYYDVKIDRGTIFGNPFDFRKLGITRAESIERYREYFLSRIKYDIRFKNQVLTLKNKILGCWCKPLECHGTVIAEYLNNLK